MHKKLKLNIIGCGKVGKTLAFLWNREGVFETGDILDTCLKNASDAVKFIGAGQPTRIIEEMHPADIFMITTPDNQIIKSCGNLYKSEILRPGNIVFLCSGSIPSSELPAAEETGVFTGSVHPVKTFPDPCISVKSFCGTFCAAEGNKEALKVLKNAFQQIGGKAFEINSDEKMIYHSATVIVCNYLTALLEFGIKCLIKSGIERHAALEIIAPIVTETVDNIFKLDTVSALTGPIARGDYEIVSKQLSSLTSWNSNYGELYRNLGCIALDLAKRKGTVPPENINLLDQLLNI